MLVIRRRAGQAIVIGDAVEVRVTEVASGRVKLAIEAPRDIPVIRKELLLTRDQNRTAATNPPLVERLVSLAARLRSSTAD